MNLKENIRTIPDFPIPGILFYDITTLIRHRAAFSETIRLMTEKAKQFGPIDAIASPEARGFIFSTPLTHSLGAGFIPIRKPGKLPYKTVSKSYELEYGSNTIHMDIDAVKPGDRVLLVDDLLATGGTMEACRALIEENGGTVVGALFAIELLELKGRQNIRTQAVESIIQY